MMNQTAPTVAWLYNEPGSMLESITGGQGVTDVDQPKPADADRPSDGMVLIEELYLSHQPGKGNMVLLKEAEDSPRHLLMFVGDAEFAAIAQEKGLVQTPRPLTHVTYLKIYENAPLEFLRVEIYDQVENAFIANIYVKDHGESRVIDSRPSDAVCLALRVGMAIYVHDKLLRSEGSTGPHEELKEFTRRVKF
jgi:bifunctional DNase/RNase